MRIALYPRVSTQEQALNGHSIDEQIERMNKYCEAMGWKVYKTYTDAGYSGANTDRPALKRMIKDIEAGKIDKVLVYKLDRLSRSQLDTLYLIEKVFLANDVDFVSMNENFDTSTPFGRAMIGILAVFAQLEREQIKERMAMGKEARAKEGKWAGGSHAPIGYDYIDGELKVNEFEKMQVMEAFEMRAVGKSILCIEQEFDKKGYTHRHGKWSRKTIRQVLERKTYLGLVSHHDEWYEGTHDAIISEDLFNKVQEVNQKQSEEHHKNNRRLGKATSYLGGYLTCSCCGAKYGKTYGMSKRKDGTYSKRLYYKCNSRNKKCKELIKDPNCKNKTWRMDDLDNLVFGEIRKLALDPDYINEIKETKEEDERPSVIQKQIENIDGQISKLMDLYTIGGMPVDVLQERIYNLNDQRTKLENELENILAENEEKLTHADAMELVTSFADVLERGDFDEIRASIGALIDYIEIDNDDIVIHWNFL